MSRRSRLNLALLALLLAAAALAGSGVRSVQSHPGGGEEGGLEWAVDSVRKGCSCHGVDPGEEITYTVGGFPPRYVPGTIYNLTLSVADGSANPGGGFVAQVSNGSFEASKGYWVSEQKDYISHTEATSDQRRWSVQWKAPAAGSGDAILKVVFNGVDSDGSPKGDAWQAVTLVSLGAPQEVSQAISIYELGVTLNAYWLGLIGIGAVLLTCLIAYFVIRGGSRHYVG